MWIHQNKQAGYRSIVRHEILLSKVLTCENGTNLWFRNSITYCCPFTRDVFTRVVHFYSFVYPRCKLLVMCRTRLRSGVMNNISTNRMTAGRRTPDNSREVLLSGKYHLLEVLPQQYVEGVRDGFTNTSRCVTLLNWSTLRLSKPKRPWKVGLQAEWPVICDTSPRL